MKKTILLLALAMLVLCSFAYATTDNAGWWVSFDINFSDVSDTGATIGTVGTPSRIINGILNNGSTYDEGDWLTAPDSNDASFSFSYWVNITSSVIQRAITHGTADAAAAIRFQTYIGNTGGVVYTSYSGGTPLSCGSVGIDLRNAGFHHIVGTFNSSNAECKLYVNGALNSSDTGSGARNNPADTIEIGDASFSTGQYFKDDLDEVAYYNRTLTADEVIELYNSGNGFNPYALPLSAPLNLSAAQPENGSGLNSLPLVFNLTVNATFDFNCSFLLNGTVNQTLNFSNGTNVFVNVSLDNLSDGEYNYQFSCFNNETTVNSSTNTFFVDFEPPTITSNFLNNSMYSEGNITGQFNFSDNQLLHSLNVTIDNVTIFNVTHIHQPTYVFNLSYPITNVSVGRHILGIEVADGHTAKVLGGDYGIIKSRDSLRYNFWDDGFVRTTSNVKGNWESIRKVDRYSQVFVPDVPSETLVFTEESDLPIYEYNLPGSYGDRWLVVGRHWKDYVVEGEPDAEVSIKRLNDKKVEVTVTGIKNNPERVVLNSVGDLNIVRINWLFYRVNLTESFDEFVFSNFETNLTLNVSFGNLTFNITGLVPVAILQWNNTNFTASLVSFDSENAIFIQNITPLEVSDSAIVGHKWFFNLSNLTQGFLNTSLVNQTIFNVAVSVCGGANNYSIVNLSYFNDVTGDSINLTNGYALAIFDGTFYYNQTGVFEGNTSDALCTNIPPSNATYNWNMWGTLTLSKDGFVTRIFNIPAVSPTLISNNPTTNLSLFLIDLGNSSTVSFTWLTEEIQPIDGTMLIYRCNADGTRSLIESTPIVTGQAVANIQLVTQPYSYEVVINGITFTDVSFTTCHLEASTAVTYYIDVLQLDLVPVIGLFLIDCVMEKLGNTTVSMSWNANPGSPTIPIEACLLGFRSGVSGLVQIYENCTTATSGSIVRTIPDNTFDYFIRGRVTQSNITGFCQNDVSFIRDTTASDLFGIMGLLSALFIVISMALFFAGDGEETVLASGIGLVVAWVFGILAFDWIIISSFIAFLALVILIGRYTRK